MLNSEESEQPSASWRENNQSPYSTHVTSDVSKANYDVTDGTTDDVTDGTEVAPPVSAVQSESDVNSLQRERNESQTSSDHVIIWKDSSHENNVDYGINALLLLTVFSINCCPFVWDEGCKKHLEGLVNIRNNVQQTAFIVHA